MLTLEAEATLTQQQAFRNVGAFCPDDPSAIKRMKDSHDFILHVCT